MLTPEQIRHYEDDGYVVVKQLLTVNECQTLKGAADRLIANWEPELDYSWMLPDHANKEKSPDRQLIDSSENITFFVENDAVDPHTGKLNRDKHVSVSMLGHDLHRLDPQFNKVVFSDKIKAIVRDLNFVEPAIRQSLYIFKQPFIGAAVPPHRDETYVFNDPFNVVGIWIALEDATVDNGCLWLIPGSNSQSTRRRYIRNTDEQELNEGKMLVYTGEQDKYDDDAFVPVEIKAGDAILFHGKTVHKSEQNKSPNSRQIYAIHILETHNSTYAKENWLQTSAPFPTI